VTLHESPYQGRQEVKKLYFGKSMYEKSQHSLGHSRTHTHSHSVICGLAKNPCLPAGRELESRKMFEKKLIGGLAKNPCRQAGRELESGTSENV
jgi:hypothetical protein